MTWTRGACLALVACAACRAPDVPPALPDTGPDQVIRDFQRTESSVGRTTLALDATRGDVYDMEHRVELVTMRVDFYSKEGEHISTLTADSGHVDTRTEDMEAYRNVRVVSEEGAVLTTTRLAWLDRSGEIHSNEFVTIRRGDDQLTGRGFTGEPSLKTFRFQEEVEAKVAGGEIRREADAAP